MVKHLRKTIAFKVLKLVHFAIKINIFKAKKASSSGGRSPPKPSDQGLPPNPCPWAPLGALLPRLPNTLVLPRSQ